MGRAHTVASQEVWQRYWEGDVEARCEILTSYYPLAVAIAVNAIRKYPPTVEVDDLIQDAGLGLIDALSKYKPGMGTKFETYATQRINGAILDGMRQRDPLSRQHRRLQQVVWKARTEFEDKHQRQPSRAEIAEYLDVSIEDVEEGEIAYVMTYPQSFDEIAPTESEELFLSDVIEDLDAQEGFEEVDERITILQLAQEIDDEEQRAVIGLIYLYGFNFREVARILGCNYNLMHKRHQRAQEQMAQALAASCA